MNEIRAITLFVQTARLGNFNQVALEQGMTVQAVSKAIRQLEDHLGIRLFHRTTRSNTLTEDGQRFLEAVVPQLDGLQRVLAGTRQEVGEARGLIRITAARPVGRKVLLPVLAEFRQLHPHIDIELILEEKFSDLVAQRIDVGFRAGPSPEAQVVTRRLFPIQDILCAAPSFLSQHGVPRDLDALTAFPSTGYRNPSTGRLLAWEFKIDGRTEYRNMPASFSTNDPETEMEAVVAGFGIGLIDSVNAVPKIRSGHLVPLLSRYVSDRRGLYIYYLQRENMPHRMRLFIDFAVKKLLDSKEHFMSTGELQKFEHSSRPAQPDGSARARRNREDRAR